MEQLNLFNFCYRVREREDGTWVVHCMFPPPNFGTTGWAHEFASYDELPEPLKERVAALDLCETADDIRDVGRKHDSVPPTYWIYTDVACFGVETV